MSNDYLDFYSKHNISPVHQDITDFNLHLQRRSKLYRQCGIPIRAFKNAKILDVGPGNGYNTLAFFYWIGTGVKCDLVEANKLGIVNMKKLFQHYCINETMYEIFESKIENYQTDKKYDIIIAEGFLHFLDNQREVIERLKCLTNDDGIIVITSTDSVGLFVEVMKRLIAQIIVKDIPDHQMKVEKLTEIFEPQLHLLKGVSRPACDWVEDQLLNPALVNKNELTFLQAIEMFGKDYDVLGSSPHIFTKTRRDAPDFSHGEERRNSFLFFLLSMI